MAFSVRAAPPVPPSATHPDAWAYEGCSEIRRLTEHTVFGHTDRWAPTPVMLGFLAATPWRRTELLAAVDARAGWAPAADHVLGVAEIGLPLTDNTHLAQVHVNVHPDQRGRGIGTALLVAAEQHAARLGRTTVLAWNRFAPEPPEGPDAITAPTGAGRVPVAAPDARFPLSHGYRLEQVARLSQLDVPSTDDGRAAVVALRDAALERAGSAYRVHVFDRDVPSRWHAPLGVLWTRMSTDIPTADLDVDEEAWDAARVAEHLQTLRRAQQQHLLTAVEHTPTGELVAFTALQIPDADVPFCFQHDTLVLAEHRGRNLGMLVKATNLLELVARRPGVRRIHTSNAEENRWMLAINEALGFRPVGVGATWRRQLRIR